MQQHEVVTTRPAAGRVVVRWRGKVVADTPRAIEVLEDGYRPVLYLPMADVRMDLLSPSEHTSRCPHKGTARYWSLADGGAESRDAAWAYDDPLDGVAAIAGHVAFYPDRVDSIEVG